MRAGAPARSPAGEHQRRPCAARASSVREPSPPPGGRKPSTSRPRRRERGDAAPEQLVLLGRRERVPDLVAPAVQPDLVAGRGDVAQGVGIELGVQALDEEGRAQVERGERLQRARQPDGDRRVVADRRARGPALEVGRLARGCRS